MGRLLSNVEILSWSNVPARPYLCLEFDWIVAYASLSSKLETKADILVSWYVGKTEQGKVIGNPGILLKSGKWGMQGILGSGGRGIILKSLSILFLHFWSLLKALESFPWRWWAHRFTHLSDTCTQLCPVLIIAALRVLQLELRREVVGSTLCPSGTCSSQQGPSFISKVPTPGWPKHRFSSSSFQYYERLQVKYQVLFQAPQSQYLVRITVNLFTFSFF